MLIKLTISKLSFLLGKNDTLIVSIDTHKIEGEICNKCIKESIDTFSSEAFKFQGKVWQPD